MGDNDIKIDVYMFGMGVCIVMNKKLTLTSDSFRGYFMHLTTGGYHSHCQLVNHHNTPFYSFVSPLFYALLFNDLIHNLCETNLLFN